MANAKIDVIVRALSKPDISATSVSMYISKFARESHEDLEIILNAVCENDIFKAASALGVLGGDMREFGDGIILKRLTFNCLNNDQITVSDLLTLLEYNRADLFERYSGSISFAVIEEAFLKCSSKNACRLMNMALNNTESEFFGTVSNGFCAFLNRYDPSGNNELKVLLGNLLQSGCVEVISKLINILGNDFLNKLCPTVWQEEIENLILSDIQSIEIWDAYFSYYFASPHTDEELHQYLWFVQLYANDELIDLVGAFFYLYVAKQYGVDCAVFGYSAVFEQIENYSRRFTGRYDEVLISFFENPKQLLKFIQKTEFCNPYFKEDIRSESQLLVRGNAANYSVGYSLLSKLFEGDTDCGLIIEIFFNTFLKRYLNIDDLFNLARKFERYENLVAAFENKTFEGTIEKYNMGVLVVSPEFYYTVNLHSIRSYYFELKYLTSINNVSNAANLKGCKIDYKIIGYNSGQLWIRTVVPPDFEQKYSPDSTMWAEKLISFSERLNSPVDSKKSRRISEALREFPAEFFVDDYNFDLMTELIINNTKYIDVFLELFNGAEWNSTFTVVDIAVPAHFYNDFKKYYKKSKELFEKLFAEGQDINKIFTLYFESIYKIILPFNEFILMAEKDKMLEALLTRRFFCKLLQGENRHKCRLQNINCAPVCVVANSHKLSDNKKLFVKCVNYIVYEDGLGKIIFEIDDGEMDSAEVRGKIFGFVSLNEHVNIFKREKISHLPKASCYSTRELIFSLERMRQAVALRKNSGDELLRLLRAFGNRNPYGFGVDTRLDVTYLKYFGNTCRNDIFLEQITQMVLNTENALFIAEIYLNTGFKYAVTVDKLVEIIINRRPELKNQLEKMFNRWKFVCVVDKNGFLLSPHLPAFRIWCGKEYIGKCVECKIIPSPSGEIVAEIISYKSGSDLVETVLLCAMLKFPIENAMQFLKDELWRYDGFTNNQISRICDSADVDAFVSKIQKLLVDNPRQSNLPDNEMLAAKNELQQIKVLVKQGGLDAGGFVSRANLWLEKWYDKLTAYEIFEMLEEMSAAYLRRTSDSDIAVEVLSAISLKYAYYMRNGSMLIKWQEALENAFGPEAVEQFRKKTKQVLKYIER